MSRVREVRRELIERDRGPAESRRELHALLVRAVRDEHLAQAIPFEVFRGQLADLSGAHEQNAAARRGRRRSSSRARRRRTGPRPRARRSRSRCGPSSRRAASARRACGAPGRACRTPPRREYACRTWPAICGSPTIIESSPEATRNRWRTTSPCREDVEVLLDSFARHPGAGGGVLDDSRGVFVVAERDDDLHAVAGRHDRDSVDALHPADRRQLRGKLPLLNAEPLPNVHGRGLVVQSDENQRHQPALPFRSTSDMRDPEK